MNLRIKDTLWPDFDIVIYERDRDNVTHDEQGRHLL